MTIDFAAEPLPKNRHGAKSSHTPYGSNPARSTDWEKHPLAAPRFSPHQATSARGYSLTVSLRELIYQHGHNNEHPDGDLEDERINPQEISSIP